MVNYEIQFKLRVSNETLNSILFIWITNIVIYIYTFVFVIYWSPMLTWSISMTHKMSSD